MKRFIVILLLSFNSSVYADPLQKAPVFSDYPIIEQYPGSAVEPNLSAPEAKKFQTNIREAALRGPNFAGHYTIGSWECGAGCLSWVIIDALTGVVWFPPFMVTDTVEICDPSLVGHSLDYDMKSELIVAKGAINGKGAGSFYYRWHNGVLEHLYTVNHSKDKLLQK